MAANKHCLNCEEADTIADTSNLYCTCKCEMCLKTDCWKTGCRDCGKSHMARNESEDRDEEFFYDVWRFSK